MQSDCRQLTFEQSQQAWQALLEAQGDTYYLQTRRRDGAASGEPVLSGCSHLFTVQIVDEVPTSLSVVTTAFAEQDLALGSHDAPILPWTMDMHYDACEQGVLDARG